MGRELSAAPGLHLSSRGSFLPRLLSFSVSDSPCMIAWSVYKKLPADIGLCANVRMSENGASIR